MSDDATIKDRIIELMFSALPATTMDEIADRIRPQMKGARVTTSYVRQALAYLRKNPEKYGWTVPHVRGGDGGERQENRYFVLLAEPDGTYYFDKNKKSLDHLRDGSKSMVTRIATESSNQAIMLSIAAKHTRKINLRRELQNLALDIEYVSRKAKALADSMVEEAA